MRNIHSNTLKPSAENTDLARTITESIQHVPESTQTNQTAARKIARKLSDSDQNPHGAKKFKAITSVATEAVSVFGKFFYEVPLSKIETFNNKTINHPKDDGYDTKVFGKRIHTVTPNSSHNIVTTLTNHSSAEQIEHAFKFYNFIFKQDGGTIEAAREHLSVTRAPLRSQVLILVRKAFQNMPYHTHQRLTVAQKEGYIVTSLHYAMEFLKISDYDKRFEILDFCKPLLTLINLEKDFIAAKKALILSDYSKNSGSDCELRGSEFMENIIFPRGLEIINTLEKRAQQGDYLKQPFNASLGVYTQSLLSVVTGYSNNLKFDCAHYASLNHEINLDINKDFKQISHLLIQAGFKVTNLNAPLKKGTIALYGTNLPSSSLSRSTVSHFSKYVGDGLWASKRGEESLVLIPDPECECTEGNGQLLGVYYKPEKNADLKLDDQYRFEDTMLSKKDGCVYKIYKSDINAFFQQLTEGEAPEEHQHGWDALKGTPIYKKPS